MKTDLEKYFYLMVFLFIFFLVSIGSKAWLKVMNHLAD